MRLPSQMVSALGNPYLFAVNPKVRLHHML